MKKKNRNMSLIDEILTNQLTRQHRLTILIQRIDHFVGSVQTIRPVISDPGRMNASSSVARFEIFEADREVVAV
jgi:hypothetical protein